MEIDQRTAAICGHITELKSMMSVGIILWILTLCVT